MVRDSNSSSDSELVDDLIDLFRAQLSLVPYTEKAFTSAGKLRPCVVQQLRVGFTKRVELARTPSGVSEFLRHPKSGKLRAALFVFEGKPFYSKTAKEHACRVHADPKDPVALAWLRRKIRTHRKSLKRKKLRFSLEWPLRSVASAVFKSGLYLDSLVLLGDVRIARRELKRRYGVIEIPKPFRIVPLERRHIDSVLRHQKRLFRANPQFGWFVATPEFLKMQRAEFLAGLKARRKTGPRDFVIFKGKELVGQFGVDINPEPIFGQPTGGMGLFFGLEAQGKGLAKVAYSILLKELDRKGIRLFHGGTSQPPVLKLSKLMKRTPVALEFFEGKGYFPKSHFSRWFPSLVSNDLSP